MAVIVTVENHPNGTIPSERRIDLEYFRTAPGILKIAQFILGVVLMALGPRIWLAIVVYIAFLITLTLIWFYFFGIQSKYQTPVPWNVMEFYYTAGATVGYAITTLLCFLTLDVIDAVFGVFNTLMYAAGAFLLLKDWKEWKSQTTGMHSPTGP